MDKSGTSVPYIGCDDVQVPYLQPYNSYEDTTAAGHWLNATDSEGSQACNDPNQSRVAKEDWTEDASTTTSEGGGIQFVKIGCPSVGDTKAP